MSRLNKSGPGGRVFMVAFCFLALLLLPHWSAAADEAADMETPAPGGLIRVYTDPAGARVLVDGVRAQDVTPVEVRVAPGVHEIRIVLEGYQEEVRTVTMADGGESSIMVLIKPVPDQAAADRKRSFAGSSINAGAAWMQLATTGITLGATVSAAVADLGDEMTAAPGLAISFRYIRPLEDRGFIIVDTNYQDARISLANVSFPQPVGDVEKIDLFLFRGGVDVSIAPNLIDYLLPYLGVGLNYTVLVDEKRKGWLGAGNQEDFIGYAVKGGFLWNSRRHLEVGVEYRYSWSYEMEDQTLVTMLGYHF